MKLDATDLRILSILQREGRITKTALADKVNLSPSPSWERLKRLEKAGLIAGYRAEIALEKIARFTTVLVEVSLTQHRFEDFERFERAIRETPEVIECHATGGGIDYVMTVVASDIDTYQRFMDALLQAEIGIERYFTYIVTRTVKPHTQPSVELISELEQTQPEETTS